MMESNDDETETEQLMAQWNKEHDKKFQLTISNVSDCDRIITISPKRFHCERSMRYSSESQKTDVSNSPSDTSSIDTSQINSLESFTGTDECLHSESVSTSGKSSAEQGEKVLYARCVIPRRYSFRFSGVRKGFEREYGTGTVMSSTVLQYLTTNSEASKYTSNDYDNYEEYSCGGPATDSTPDGRSDPDGISLTLDRPTLKNNTKKSKIPIFVKKAYLKRYINNTINSRKCVLICESDMASNMSESTDDQIQNHIPISADPETDESPEIIVERFEIEPASTPIRNLSDTAAVPQQSEEAMSEDDTKKLKHDAPYAISPTLEPTISDIFNEIITINETDNAKTILETSIVGPDKVKNVCEIIDLKAVSTKTELDFTPKDLSHITTQTVSETTTGTSNRPPEVRSSSTVVKEFDPLLSEEVSAMSLDNKTSEDINETTSQSATNVSPSTGVNNEGASAADCACVTSDSSKLGLSVDLVALVDSETSVAISMESEGLGPAPPASQQSQEICQTEVKSSTEKRVIEVREQDDEPPQPTLTQEEWERRENALLLKIIDLEKQKDNASIEGMRMQLKVRAEENDLLKHKVCSLESELKAVLNNPDSNKNKELLADIKRQHDELLAKARAMIYDKTKMVRHQETQIEALSGQVFSLKEVVGITKDLLGIRNLEVKNLRDRLDATEAKILTERERQKLLMTRVDTGMKKNEELRNEYTNQLSLFKELRERYEARVDDLRVENKKLADQIGDITKKF